MTPIKLLLLVLFFLTPVILVAQDIESDRPDKTDSPNTLEKGKFQIETGIEYSLHKYDNFLFFADTSFNVNLKVKTLTAPTTLLRYGLVKNVELRLGFDFDRTTISSNAVVIDNTAGLTLNPPTIGAKVFISKGEGIIPDFGILGSVKIPNVGDELKQVKHFVPELALAFSNDITDKLNVGYNLGVGWQDDLGDKEFFYSVSFGTVVTPKVGAFAEIYGNLPASTDASDQNIDAGITYRLKKNIQLDVYGGLGLSEQSNNFFMGTGVSIGLN